MHKSAWVMLALAGATPALADESPCAAPPGPPAHVWHVNGDTGDDAAGDGSLDHPWKSLAALFRPGPWGLPKLSSVPVRGAANPSAPVHPGDAVLLAGARSSYGVLELAVANSDWVTIGAEPGARPRVDRIALNGSAKFALSGLTVESEKTAEDPRALILGAATDTRFDNLLIESAPDGVAATWSKDDWIAKARDAAYLAPAGQCATFTSSVMVRNVRSGVFFSSPWTTFSGSIDGACDDFLRPGCSHCSVVGARLVNSNVIGDGNHNDFVQIFFGPFDEIRIADNVMVRDAGRVYFPGAIQGIDDFGDKETITRLDVENNVVVTSGVCHGITFGKVDGARIANNFVRGDGALPNPGNCLVWIALGTMAKNVTLENNLADNFIVPQNLKDVTVGFNACLPPLPGRRGGCKPPLRTGTERPDIGPGRQ